MSGESTEWEQEESDPEDMMDQVLRSQPWLKVKKMQVPTVKLVLSLGDKIVYHGANLLRVLILIHACLLYVIMNQM